MVGKSWFSTTMWQAVEKQNLQQTYSQSSTTLAVECTEVEAIKVKKIRIYPTTNQKKIFQSWLGASRFIYNKTVEHLKLPKEERCKGWMAAVQKILGQNKEDWIKVIPHKVKAHAVADAYLALKTGFALLKKKLIPKFELKFRTRKKPKQSCFIPKSALTNNGIYHTISGKLKMHDKIPNNPSDLRLVYYNNRWYLHIPYKTKVNSIDNQNRVIALDPGVRTFITGFSSENVFKIGTGDFSRIARLSIFADKLISKISKAKAKSRYRIKKALSRIRNKIKDLVDELHFKTINFLVNNYDRIILPTFETKQMACKIKRKIQSKSVRSMLSYSFFRLAERLISKAKQLGKSVIRISEAYTSKTASWTGEIIEKLGSRKYISSNGITVDRDINGARGIYLRALGDSPSVLNDCALLAIVNEKLSLCS